MKTIKNISCECTHVLYVRKGVKVAGIFRNEEDDNMNCKPRNNPLQYDAIGASSQTPPGWMKKRTVQRKALILKTKHNSNLHQTVQIPVNPFGSAVSLYSAS